MLFVVVEAVTCLASELPRLLELPVEDSALASPPSDTFSVAVRAREKAMWAAGAGIDVILAKEDDNRSA